MTMQPSTDALRKRRARAEGRVKPRPRKGPPTLQARIEATQKSIVTRCARIAELDAMNTTPDADHDALRDALAKAREGLRRAEATLRTYRNRLPAEV